MMPGDRRVAHGELGSKTRDFSALAKHAAPDPGMMLRKRLREEMEAIQGILKKAELLVGSSKNVDKARPAPRRGKDGRFVAAEAPSKKKVDRAPCVMSPPPVKISECRIMDAKKRKTPPPVEIIESQIMESKKRKTLPPVEIIKAQVPQHEVFSFLTRRSGKTVDKGRAAPLSGKDGRFLAAERRSDDMKKADQAPCAKKQKTMAPPPPVEINQARINEADRAPCAKKTNTTPLITPEEIIEIMTSEDEGFSLLTPLSPRVFEFLNKECTSHAIEKAGELAEEEKRPIMDGGKNAKKRKTTPPRVSEEEALSLVTQLSTLASDMPPRVLEFLSKECSSHTNEKAGEIEIELGSMSRSAMSELHKLLDEFAEEKKQKLKDESVNLSRSVTLSSMREIEDGEIIEDEDCGGEMIEEEVDICGGVSPIAIEKFVEIAKSPSDSSSSGSSSSSSSSSSGSSCSDSSDSDSSDSDSDDECVTSNPSPPVFRQTGTSPMVMPHKVLSPIAEEEFAETVKKQRNSSSVLLEDGEIQEEQDLSSATPVRSSPAPIIRCQLSERQRAYMKLEEMERNAKPVFDYIHPRHLWRLGITPSVQYAATSELCAPVRGCPCPVQRLLGLFLKVD